VRSSLLFAALILSGCHRDQDAKGPFEKAGAGLDRATDKTGRALTTAATRTGDAVEKAGQATGRALERVGHKLDGSASTAPAASSTASQPINSTDKK